MLDGLPGGFFAIEIRLGIVVIGPDGQRDAPVSHGAGGVQLRRALERKQRLVVVKAVDQGETLVEEFLSFGVFGGYRVMHVAQPGHQHRLAGRRSGVVVLGEEGEWKEYSNRDEKSHVLDFTSKVGGLERLG